MQEAVPLVVCIAEDSGAQAFYLKKLITTRFGPKVEVQLFPEPSEVLLFALSNKIDFLMTDLTFERVENYIQAVSRMLYEIKKRNPEITTVILSGRTNAGKHLQNAFSNLLASDIPRFVDLGSGETADTPNRRELQKVYPKTLDGIKQVDHILEKPCSVDIVLSLIEDQFRKPKITQSLGL